MLTVLLCLLAAGARAQTGDIAKNRAIAQNLVIRAQKEPDSKKRTALYTEAAKYNPRLEIIFINRGVAYSELRQLDKAVADCGSALALNPENATALNNRGYYYQWLGKWKESKADLDAVVALNDDFHHPYCNLMNYWWGHRRDKRRALHNLDLCLKNGSAEVLRLKRLVYDPNEDGHFLQGLNETPEFKAIIARY